MPRDDYPDPDEITDLPEFIEALERLRVWAGNPSYRVLAKQVGPMMRPPRVVAHTTVTEVFRARRRRRLDLDLVSAVLRALGVSAAEVARWGRAGIRVHAAAKSGGPSGVLRQLPADPVTFTGREVQLAALFEAAAGSRTIVITAIEGMAGVGKTQLAVHAAHELVRAGRYADVQLYVNLRGFAPDQAPADPGVVLDGFLRQLEVPAQQIPDSLEERSAMFRDRMHGRDALVLLDDAADAAQVRELIPASPSCLVLITSRRTLADLEGATPHQLEVFTLDEALALLTEIVGAERVGAEPEAAEQIARACGFLPLALSIAASRLRSRPAWSLGEIVQRLSAGLEAVAVKGRALRSVFDLSYRGLSEPEQRVFRLLGLHPGTTFTAPAVAALAGVEVIEAEKILESLLDEHLLQQQTAEHFILHDLLRRYAAELVAEEPEPEGDDAAVARLTSWYVNAAYRAAQGIDTPVLPEPEPDLLATVPAFADYDSALAWFEEERENLTAVQQAAAERGMHAAVWQLGLMPKQFYVIRRYHHDWLAAQQLAVAAARAAGDRAVEARMLSGLGAACWKLDMIEEAGQAYSEARAVFHALGDRPGEGRTVADFGVLRFARGDYEGAGEFFEQALPLLDSDDEDALRPRGMCLMNLGVVHGFLGHPQEALDTSLLALAIFRRISERLMQAMVLGNVGEYFREVGDLEQSFERYRESLELSRALGDQSLEADALLGLGDTAEVAGRREEARRYWEQALDGFEAIGHPRVAEARERLAAAGSGSAASGSPGGT